MSKITINIDPYDLQRKIKALEHIARYIEDLQDGWGEIYWELDLASLQDTIELLEIFVDLEQQSKLEEK